MCVSVRVCVCLCVCTKFVSVTSHLFSLQVFLRRDNRVQKRLGLLHVKLAGGGRSSQDCRQGLPEDRFVGILKKKTRPRYKTAGQQYCKSYPSCLWWPYCTSLPKYRDVCRSLPTFSVYFLPQLVPPDEWIDAPKLRLPVEPRVSFLTPRRYHTPVETRISFLTLEGIRRYVSLPYN